VKCKPDLLDIRDISMAGLVSSKGGSAIVGSGLELISGHDCFSHDDIVLSQHGFIPSNSMISKFKLPSDNFDKLRLCMLERCGSACIEFLYALYALRAGYPAKILDNVVKSLVVELKSAWTSHNLCNCYEPVVGSSRLLNLIVAVLACRSIKEASLFLQCVFPVSTQFSKLVTVNDVTGLHSLVTLVEQNYEFCKKLSYVGDKLLRLVVNLAYFGMGKFKKAYYTEIDEMLTKRNIGKPLVVGADLGLTQTSADNCRARFILSVLCCPNSLCSIGRDLGLLNRDVWHVFDHV